MRCSLRDIAHVRTGDKGALVTISVTTYERQHYSVLVDQLTSDAAVALLGQRVKGDVVRYELPRLASLLFVCSRDPHDTVNTSLYRDRHGKTLGSALYGCEVEVEWARIPG